MKLEELKKSTIKKLLEVSLHMNKQLRSPQCMPFKSQEQSSEATVQRLREELNLAQMAQATASSLSERSW